MFFFPFRREKDLKMCEDLIYTGSSTTSGAPLLTPRQIQDTMMQLRDMTKKLEKGIRDVLEDVENKKKVKKYELPDKTSKMACVGSKDSDQPGHPPSLTSLHCLHEESLGP